MNKISAVIGLFFLLVKPALGEPYSETNEYEFRGEIWAEFKSENGEYSQKCRLDPESVIRIVEDKENYIYAKLLVSAAWDLPNGPARFRNACRNPITSALRFEKQKIEKWRGNILHFKKR